MRLIVGHARGTCVAEVEALESLEGRHGRHAGVADGHV